jgi:microcystin-dependent protein
MAEAFIGQLSLVAFNFPPRNWAQANGQILTISSNNALFSLLGTTYGGNGTSTFGLPNLQSAVAIGSGQGPGTSRYARGEAGGVPAVMLTPGQTPNHNHTAMAREARALVNTPVNNSMAESTSGNIYSTATSPLVTMSPSTVPLFGDTGPHNNMMPYLGLNWVIALQGIFPPRD